MLKRITRKNLTLSAFLILALTLAIGSHVSGCQDAATTGKQINDKAVAVDASYDATVAAAATKPAVLDAKLAAVQQAADDKTQAAITAAVNAAIKQNALSSAQALQASATQPADQIAAATLVQNAQAALAASQASQTASEKSAQAAKDQATAFAATVADLKAELSGKIDKLSNVKPAVAAEKQIASNVANGAADTSGWGTQAGILLNSIPYGAIIAPAVLAVAASWKLNDQKKKSNADLDDKQAEVDDVKTTLAKIDAVASPLLAMDGSGALNHLNDGLDSHEQALIPQTVAAAKALAPKLVLAPAPARPLAA